MYRYFQGAPCDIPSSIIYNPKEKKDTRHYTMYLDSRFAEDSSIPYSLSICLRPSKLVGLPIPSDLSLLKTPTLERSYICNCRQLQRIEIGLARARMYFLDISF